MQNGDRQEAGMCELLRIAIVKRGCPIDTLHNPTFSIHVTEKGFGEHQLSPGAGDEIWQVLPGLQADSAYPPPGKGQAGHHCQQHAAPPVSSMSARGRPITEK